MTQAGIQIQPSAAAQRIPLRLWVILGCLLTLLVGGGIFVYRGQVEQSRADLEANLQAIAQLKVDQIAAWREGQLNDALELAENELFLRQTVDYLTNPAAEGASSELFDLFTLIRDQHDYSNVVLLDLQGEVRLSLNNRMAAPARYAVGVETAVQQTRPLIVDLHTGPLNSSPHISVLLPIADPDTPGEPVGAVALITEAEDFLYPLLRSWPLPSDSAETLLVRREADGVLFLNDLRYREDAALTLSIPLTRSDLPAVQAVQGREGFFVGQDYRNVEVAAVLLPVPDSPWFMVSKIDAAEAFAGEANRLRLLLLSLIGAVVGSVGYGMLYWQLSQRNYFQTLYHTESRLRAGMARHNITLNAIGDGVIVTDADGRVELLNPAAEQLTGWTAAEAMGERVTAVFKTIDEQSGQPTSSPVEQVISTQQAVEKADHLLLQTRAGVSRPIAAGGAPIFADDGALTGAVLVFRDQSEERLAQRLTHARLELVTYAADHSLPQLLTKALDLAGELVDSPIGFIHFVEPDEKTISLQQWSTRTLDEFCAVDQDARHYPLDEAGVWVDCVRRREPVIHEDYTALAHKKGLPEGHAEVLRELIVPVLRGDKVVAILGVGNKLEPYTEQDVDIINFFADVTWQIVEHKRSEQAVLENERRYQTLLNLTPVGIAVHAEGRMLFINPEGARLLGAERPEQIIGREIAEFVTEDLSAIEADLAEIRAGKKLTYPREDVYRRLDGTEVAVQVVAATPLNFAGKEAIQVVVMDISEKRAAANRLQESEALLAKAEEVAQMGSWRWNLQTRESVWSRGLYRIFGTRPEDVEGDPQQLIVRQTHPEDLKRLRASDQEVLKNGVTQPHLYRIRRPDGRDRILFEEGELIYDEDGRAVSMVGYIQDVTERKEAEAQLHLQAAALASTANAIVITDRQGVIEWVNPAYTALTGFAFSDVVGKTPRLQKSGLHDETFYQQLWETVLNGEVWHGEIINKRRDGSYYTEEQSITPVPDAHGEITHFVAIKQDITLRKRDEEEKEKLLQQIHQQAQQLQKVMEGVPEGILLLDSDHVVQMTNPAAQRDLAQLAGAGVGMRMTHLGGMPLSTFLQPAALGRWHELDTAQRTYEISAQPVTQAEQVQGWVLALRDVTEQRAVEEQLQRQERLAAVGQLAAGIAHDFNNLLAVIMLHAQLLEATLQLPPREEERLTTIVQQTQRAAQLIEQILDFSRRSTMEKRPLDLRLLLKEQVKLLQRTLPEHIDILLQAHDHDFMIEADLTRIQQVIMNLAVNARDAMENGGRLTLSLRHFQLLPKNRPPIPNMNPGAWVHLAVSDDGVGIASEHLDHVFDPFFTTKETGKGTGLGLAQVYGIVSQHDGHIDVTSAENVGTTFNMFLPALVLETELAPQVEEMPVYNGRGQHILVVEDEETLREALVDTLSLWQYDVVVAPNGARALRLLQTLGGQVDLIISDVVMPQMGGIDFIRAVREREWEMPVILISGHPQDLDMRDMKQLGIMTLLSKPLNPHQLNQVLHEALP